MKIPIIPIVIIFQVIFPLPVELGTVELKPVAGHGPVVRLKHGNLQGVYFDTPGGKRIDAYLGIPYAEPPIGGLRFENPKPLKPWPGTLKATLFGDQCLQYLEFFKPGEDRVVGSEDCLYLNVYVPHKFSLKESTTGKGLDVIVYLHGGSFMWGGSSDDLPTLLVPRQTILVTINYRLNIFGFLSTEDEVIPGNYGLKDQTMALHWIKDNIGGFGGNPESITIMGYLAGGASVHYHYLSPSSKGLFHKGISMGGTATTPWAQTEGAKMKAKRLADLVGCPSATSHDIQSCLKTRPPRLIVDKIKDFLEWIYNPFTPFGPVVESGTTKEPFMTTTPIQQLQSGKVQNLPWLLSSSTEDGLYPVASFLANDTVMRELQKKFHHFFPYLLDYNLTVTKNHQHEVSDKIKKFYFDSSDVGKQSAKVLTRMVGDRMFLSEADRSARLQSAANSQPVYFYRYAYRGKHSLTEIMSRTNLNWGVANGDDAMTVVPIKGYNPQETSDDASVSHMMLDIVTSFAKTGAPSISGISNSSLNWKPVTHDSSNVLVIKGPDKVEVEKVVDLGNRTFWDSLPIQEPQIKIQPKPVKEEL